MNKIIVFLEVVNEGLKVYIEIYINDKKGVEKNN